MAVIAPTNAAIEGDVSVVTWTGVATANTHTAQLLRNNGGAVACMQVSGTFGGATVVLQGSNDNVTFATIKDMVGNSISFTAAGLIEFSTAAAYIRPNATGGAGDSLVVSVAVRG